MERGALRPIVALLVTAVFMQALLEFGPLWMVALAAPPVSTGPSGPG